MIYQYMQDWLEALRSGNYKQTNQVLKEKRNSGSIYYCCLGVAADCVLKVPNKLSEFGSEFGFNFGDEDFSKKHMLSTEAAALLDLHKSVSDDEVVKACKYLKIAPDNVAVYNMSRQRFLAALNDLNVSFHNIANVVQHLDWDTPDRIDLMNHWISELRSGDYEQARGWLKRRFPIVSHCCLGIAAEKVLGRKFAGTPTTSIYERYEIGTVGGSGYSTLLSSEDNELLGLDVAVSNEEGSKILTLLNTPEKDYISLEEFIYDVEDDELGPRYSVLSKLNDGGATFNDIADVIEYCEWNK